VRAPLTIALLLALAAPALRAQDDEAPGPAGRKMVVSIRFEGNRRYDDTFLKDQVQSREGEPLDNGLLTTDERILRRLFTAVTEIETNDVEGGVEIVYYVEDRVIVGKVEVRGVTSLEKKDYEPLLSTRKGRPLLDYAMRADRDLLERLHREKGFHFVDVEYYQRRTSKPDVEDVVFQVLAHNRIKVDRVILEGGHSVDRDLLLQQLRNKAHDYGRAGRILANLLNPIAWFKGLLSPAYFDREALDTDRRMLEFVYRNEGFLDAKVVLVGVRFDAERKYVTVHYRIDEGAPYELRSLVIEYAPDGEPEEGDREFLSVEALSGLAAFLPGDRFRAQDVGGTTRAISERLWSRAYAKSSVEAAATPVADTRQVDLTLTLHAGEKIRVGRVRVVGNRWTRHNVILRQFRDGARPGDYLNIESLEAARTRLLALQYFTSVRFGSGGDWGLIKSANADRPDEYDIELNLVEQETTRNIRFGAGVSTDGGANATVSVTWNNFDIRRPPKNLWSVLDRDAFRGGGQQFQLTLSPGTRFSAFQISFRDPALRDSRWSFSTDISRRFARFDEYGQTTDGITIRVGKFLDRRFRWLLSLNWSLREILIDNPATDAPINALDEQGYHTQHGVGFTLRRAARRGGDAFLNGHITTLRSSFYGGPLGADIDVFKVHLEHAFGWRMFKNSKNWWRRMSTRVVVDWATGFGNTDQVPIWERFFMGGRNLRGFAFRQVGPRSNGSPTGGEFMVAWSTDYTIPLVGREKGFGLDLVLFVDQGGLSLTTDTWDGDTWRITAGFGIALGVGPPNQPPILIDFGFALRKRDTDETQLVSISLVRNF